MANVKIEELKLCVEELNKLLASAQQQKVKDILSIDIRKLESEMIALREQTQQAREPTTTSNTAPAKPRRYEVKLNSYSWTQTEKFVKIYVTLPNIQGLNQSEVSCKFTNRSVDVHVQGLNNRNYHLPIHSLLEEIDVDKSYWKVKPDTVLVFLMKSKVGSTWSHMTLPEKKAKEPKLPKMDSSGDGDPSASLMTMMKQMYEDGDDDMKRTIAKAWTESREKQMAGGEF